MQKQIADILKSVEDIVAICEEQHLTDEQWYLEFENKLNALSVKDHCPIM